MFLLQKNKKIIVKHSLFFTLILYIAASFFTNNACLSEQKSYFDYLSDTVNAIEASHTKDSINSIKKAIDSNPNDPLVHVALGIILLRGNRPSDAMTEFSTAREQDKKCTEAIYGTAVAYLSMRKFGQAASLFSQAQATLQNNSIKGSIAYVNAIKDENFTYTENSYGDRAIKAINALALMKVNKYSEALNIWKELQKNAIGPSFGELPGCVMSFEKMTPVIFDEGKIAWSYQSTAAKKKKLASVSGKLVLRADLSRAQNVSMVMFYIDGKVVGITNTQPFQYPWMTTSVENGIHKLKIEGIDSSGNVISEKSADVFVENKSIQSFSEANSVAEKEIRSKIWNLLVLKPSVAVINYNLARCAIKLDDIKTAKAALEKVVAADPGFMDADEKLSAICRSEHKYQRLMNLNTSKKIVAITFDDGPKAATPKLLKVLKNCGIKATFFLVGKQCVLFPDIVKEIRDDGHDIENHTYDHLALDYITNKDIEQELFKNIVAIRSIAGIDVDAMRPPGGHIGTKLPVILQKYGITMVLWTTNCVNMEGTSKQNMEKFVLSRVKPGTIFLMHNVDEVTMLALPDIITSLRKQGYSFTTISEVINSQKN